MNWFTKAPGIKEGIFKITIGRKDDQINPTGIKVGTRKLQWV